MFEGVEEYGEGVCEGDAAGVVHEGACEEGVGGIGGGWWFNDVE